MAEFSIIVPSYNQARFIGETLENLVKLKAEASKKDIKIQIILVDNCSDEPVQAILKTYSSLPDVLIIEKDKGQYDAINKGLKLVKGSYWSWLNTDDLIDIEGFLFLAEFVSQHPHLDYVYGDVSYIDENSQLHKISTSGLLSLDQLVHVNASISQPGSFFKTAFTDKLGELAPYHFAFDYEYILRCMKHEAKVARIDKNLAYFRYYTASKSGSKDYRFLDEQLQISKLYGGKVFSQLGFLLRLRILKRRFLRF